MSVQVLARSQLIPRPRAGVFAFFEDAANLARITPGFLGFGILTPLPIEMRQGTLIDYRLSLFGLPLTWKTRIDLYEPPVRFVDTRLEGPYRLWRHTHEFLEVPAGTEITDRVEYDAGFGPLGGLAHALCVRRTLAAIFDHRARAIAQIFAGSTSSGEPQKTARAAG